ncbi:hypothetical protein BH24CHL5_BH24CHL5_12000 [soil metagenome]
MSQRPAGAESPRPRIVWTTLFVLVALGGAGLAVAADRPHNPVHRPELTVRADQRAQPWIDALGAELALIATDIGDLSAGGRDVLAGLQSLDLTATDAALADGDALAEQTDAAADDLISLRTGAHAEIEEWRLGSATVEQLASIDAATASAQRVSTYWQGLAAHARPVSGLVATLLCHDGTVFRATTAGRQAAWDDALGLLDEAARHLAAADAVRDELAASGINVETLSDLLGRYRAYDEALVALYTYARDTGEQSGDTFAALQAAVDEAQAALPADNRAALTVIVGEAAGPSVTMALVDIEAAHGSINEAIDAITPDEPQTTP